MRRKADASGPPLPARPLTAAAQGLLIALLAGCGGIPGTPARVAPATPVPLLAADEGDPLEGLDLPDSDALDVRAAAVWEHLAHRGVVPYDPSAVLRGSDVADFVRYLTWQETRIEGDVHHVVFVTDGRWDPARVDAFVRFFAAMPARTPARAGAPRFHFVPAQQLPQAIDWLFGGQWYGSLESELLAVLAELPADASRAGEATSRVRETFARWGIVVPPNDGALPGLDALVAMLPAPLDPDDPWIPRGILVGAGLLLGDALAAGDPGLAWIGADEGLATVFALSVDGDVSTMLRPIDYALLTWRGTNPAPFTAYAELARRRVDEARRAAR